MRFSDLLKLIKDNLGRRKGRVAMTAIGVVIGTASVVLLISLALGLQKSATSNLWGISDLSRVDVYPKYEMSPIEGSGGAGGSSSSNQPKKLTTRVIDQIRVLPDVAKVIGYHNPQVQAELRYGKYTNYPFIQGVSTKDMADFGYKLQDGVSTLTKGTCIIGIQVTRNFMDPKAMPSMDGPMQTTELDLLNQNLAVVLTKYAQDGTMTTKRVNLKVVGIFAEARAEQDYALFVNIDDAVSWTEWAQGKRWNFNKDGYDHLYVKASQPEKATEVAKSITEMGFQANTPQEMIQGINSFFVILQLVFGGIGAISLLVAAIGIANTMTMSILERTREIGLMKAIGATNRDVLSIFLGESAGIGFIGGLGGILIGFVGGQLITLLGSTSGATPGGGMMGIGGLTAATPAWLLFFGLIFATLIGLLSGLFPSLKAATMVPVDALKYE